MTSDSDRQRAASRMSRGPLALEASAAVAAAPVSPDMDPRLQRIVAMGRQDARRRSISSTGIDEVAVIAKVTDANAWEALSEVRVGARLGPPAADGSAIVTGRIPIARIEQVRTQPFVTSLKAARPVLPALDRTVPEITADPAHLPAGTVANGGANAIVGVVDFGCDFAHDNLRDGNGRSRVLAIWDQNGTATSESPFGYGRLFRKAQIDSALTKSDPYGALGYGPDASETNGTHGTHVTDIAAGNGRGSHVPGVAPNARLLFVELAASDIPWDGPEAVGKSFGDSVQLLEALKFIFDEAKTAPCVINMSLGTNGGPHDGSTLAEQGIDRLVREQPNRAVVIAASNSFADGIHAGGTVPQGGSVDLAWTIPNNDGTSNEMEIWYAGGDRFTVEVIGPDGASVAVVPPGQNKTLTFEGRVVMFLANRLADPNNGDNMIGLFLEPELPAGRWTVRLRGDTVQNGRFHAWIERDDNGQSSFAPPLDNAMTIGSISCGRETIVVGSYDAHKAALPLSFFSSAGPTRDGREKPEICAPGHAVVAARSRSRTGVTQKSGTSMASPAVAGVIALMLSEARARGKDLTIADIRDILRRTARQHPQQGGALWNARTGMGRVGASAAVRAVATLGAPGPSLARTEVLEVAGKGRIKTPQKPRTARPKPRVPAGRPTVSTRRSRGTR